MKYLKRFNESKESGANIVSNIRSEIEDILVEFTFSYDIRFVHYDTLKNGLPHSIFELQILPKGFPDSNHTILIDEDILDDLRRVSSFIKLEIGFKYSHSYYYAENRDNPGGSHLYEKDIFSSSGRLVSVIQMFFTGPDDLDESSAFESYQGVNDAGLVRVYGKENLEECDSLMLDIKDLSYDLLDLGFEVKIDYSHSTMFERDKTPKIEVNIIGEDKLFDENYIDVVLPVIEDIKKYVSNLGFCTGGHLFNNSYRGLNKLITYKLLIQK
jgi:hypothetical protein